jgi:hypothetical protein
MPVASPRCPGARSGLVVIVSLAAALGGCVSHIGPRTVPADRVNYNEAIAQSWSEQLLLNLVRLRYRDNPLFLEPSGVVTHYEVVGKASAAAGANLQRPGSTSVLDLGAGVEYHEAPTVAYSPLSGEDFAVRILSPIPPATILLLSESGWSLSRLFTCCVQQANGLRNAVGAAGPTPDYVPPFEQFQRLAQALRQLQIAGLVDVESDRDGMRLLMRAGEGGAGDRDAAEVRRLLKLDPTRSSYRIRAGLVQTSPDEIAINARSLLAVMFFLSQSVEVPPADERAGVVTVTERDGKRFDWSEVTGSVLRIRTSPSTPDGAAVKTRYRNAWFWIADADLTSKTTFTLLTYLFNLQAAGRERRDMLLTYPVK